MQIGKDTFWILRGYIYISRSNLLSIAYEPQHNMSEIQVLKSKQIKKVVKSDDRDK